MARGSLLDDALGVLLGDALSPVVDLVLCRRDGAIEAHARAGSVRLSVGGDGEAVPSVVRGRDPLAKRDPGAFSPLGDELANLRPPNERNHYPHAYESMRQLFADPRAPDLAVVHTPAHNWEERGGHRGEHGSLDVVQSRAPLVLAGPGVRGLGALDRSARMVDVAPTIAGLLGLAPRGWDGRALDESLDPASASRRVVVFLWDGANANVLYAAADAGELPAVARLMAEGTTYRHGCIASFPSVTLANHTTAVTGMHPGRHGILNNAYFDRATGRQIVANAPDTWHLARFEIRTDVETIFESVGRTGRTAAVNEPADRGAGYSTFDFLRSGEVEMSEAALPDPRAVRGATGSFVASSREYAWATSADHLALQQATGLWAGEGGARPRLAWVNLILPDAAAHAGGPYSEIARAGLRDTDRRMGAILDAMDWGGGETAFVLLADHGMEESDPECKGDFDDALARAGIPFRDEGYGFVYLDPRPNGKEPGEAGSFRDGEA